MESTPTHTAANAIVVQNLQKSFKDLKVLHGIDFRVRRGSILALLGPNGAGKTTTIRILSTLLPPDDGQVYVNGYDVVKQACEVRSSIGLTGQFAAVDIYLTGEENLQMLGRLYRLSQADTKRRTQELLVQFDLVDAARRPVKTYSGGMKRRLDLAMSLIAAPPVIFLDEPTTGLDPRSRLNMWAAIKNLANSGATILLTTQYMDEADYLADWIVVIDEGRVIAEGDANTLKSRVGSDHVDLTISPNSNFALAQQAVDGEQLQAVADQRILTIAATNGATTLKQILQRLEDAQIEVESVSMRRPTLDDVFMFLTDNGMSKDGVHNDGESIHG
ncbi:ATP-binding cassette domain-containing protein [Aggregatilinea lenta]|uniref:ATP-binding cassette domain-containing protein n=1 Tax=Aggregatilinea lenta TaxID=913108 RepID=UPI000E5B6468|nr:ATP-binding cassette domain-containing protein [Aggregatilinea lenta]